MIQLTDAEQAFADSPDGGAHVAHARYKHALGERHKGDRAAPWTDAHAADAARRGARDKARANLAVADAISRTPALKAAAETAAAMRDECLRNGYKRQGAC